MPTRIPPEPYRHPPAPNARLSSLARARENGLVAGTHPLGVRIIVGPGRGCALCNQRAARLYTRGTLTTVYVVVGVGGVLNRALIA